MHKNNRLKESISAFFSRFVISFPFLYYSPRPDSTASTMALSASFSSSPSQVNSITSPHWAQALSTLKTLLALAVSSRKEKVIVHLKRMASLQRFPAGLKCRPVGFFMVTF